MLERKFISEKSIKRQSHKMVKHTKRVNAKRVRLKEMWEGCTLVTFKFFLIIKIISRGEAT